MSKTKEENIQEHIDWLVEHEIYCPATWCMTDLTRYAEENPRDSAIDIDEYWRKSRVCPECSCCKLIYFDDYMEENPEFDIQKYNKEHPYHEIEPYRNYYYVCSDCGAIFDDPDQAEIYEYWFVSDALANELESVGEIVLTQPYVSIWCRQCSGQAIKMDYCMRQIAERAVERFEK